MAKVSRLCLHCPNFNENYPNEGEGDCKGYYLRDAENACKTFKSWKGGNLTYKEALGAKRKQHERHDRTDRFRSRTEELILEYQQPQVNSHIRKQAEDLASKIAKGANAFKELPKAKETYNLYLPHKLCRAIEENRHRLIKNP